MGAHMKHKKIEDASHLEEMQIAFAYVEGVSDPNGKRYPPTIDELRRVARYLSEMGLYSAAGKLFVRADLLERVVEEYLKAKAEVHNKEKKQS